MIPKRSFSVFAFIYIALAAMSNEIDSTLFRKSFSDISSLGLPVVVIETVNDEFPFFELAEKENPDIMWGTGITNTNKVPGRLFIYENGKKVFDSGEYVEKVSGMTIKIRGNVSAANHDKKPYKIKLQSKADLLMRGKQFSDKNWLLIKDNNLNAKIGFKVNEFVGMQWTPSYRYVNVMFNGRYFGVYMLCESVCRNPGSRLDVSKSGYVFEWDTYWWNNHKYVESSFSSPLKYTFKYPDEDDITEEQIRYMQDEVFKAETSLSQGSYPEYIDVESFAAWILAHDILGTWDAAGSNYFLTKYDDTSDSKIMMANLWDLETNFRRINQWSTAHLAGWFFYESLFDNINKAFIKEYKEKWENIKDALFNNIIIFLDNYLSSEECEQLNASIELDNSLWGTEWKTAEVSIKDAKKWFVDRKDWLNNEMAKISIDTNATAIKEMIKDNNPRYGSYNLNGISIERPPKDGMVIEKGGKYLRRR